MCHNTGLKTGNQNDQEFNIPTQAAKAKTETALANKKNGRKASSQRGADAE